MEMSISKYMEKTKTKTETEIKNRKKNEDY